jgi:simple sugar transport system ATP-binding protein
VEPLVRMEKISKSFGPVRALCQVDLTLHQREILGLVGDNGAGKSTLMKVLTGVYQSDEGEIYLNGQRVRFNNPYDSRNAGVEMVYQDLALAGHLPLGAGAQGEEKAQVVGDVSVVFQPLLEAGE